MKFPSNLTCAQSSGPFPPQPAPTMPTAPMQGKKATLISLNKVKPHQWKKLAYVVVAEGHVSFNEFDTRYTSPRSRFGKYLRQLRSQGIDVSHLLPNGLKEEDKTEDLILVMARRLCEKLSKKDIKNWDWNKPTVKHSHYYKLAKRILEENDPESACRIVNLITGYA